MKIKPFHEATNLEDANLKLAELIAVDFRDFEFSDLAFGSLPVTLSTDGERIATAIFCYPPGSCERMVAVVWPPVSVLMS